MNSKRGILVVIGSNMINAVTFMVSVFAALFLVPVSEQIGVDYSKAALVFTGMTIGTLGGYSVMGKIFSAMSAKKVYLLGSISVPLALISMVYVKSLPLMIAIWVLVGFLQTFISNGGVQILCSEWVGIGKGTVVSICPIIVAFTGMIFSPLASVWITKFGLKKTAIVISIVMFAIAIILTLLCIYDAPEKYGDKPIDLKFLAGKEQKDAEKGEDAAKREITMPYSEIKKLSPFWILLLFALVISVAQMAVYSNRSGLFDEMGCTLVQNGILGGIWTIAAAVIVLIFGVLSDRFGARVPMILFAAIGLGTYLCWPLLKNGGFTAAIIICCLANVAQIGQYIAPTVMLPMFGATSSNEVISKAGFAAALGSTLAPVLVAALPSYDVMIALEAVFFGIGLLCAVTSTGKSAMAKVDAAEARYRENQKSE